MIYLEFITGSDYPSDEPVFGSTGSGVHAEKKYCFMRLFLKNTPFNRFFTLQFSSNRLLTFFATSVCRGSVRKAAGSPLLPANAITSEKLGEKGVIQEKFGYKKIKKNSLPCFYKKRFFPASVVNKHIQQPKLQ